MLDAARAFVKEVRVQALSPEYLKSYWKTRYVSLRALPVYSNLPEILEAERAEVKRLLAEVCGALEALGYDPASPKEAMKSFATELAKVIAAKSNTKFFLPDETFDARFKRDTTGMEAASWGQAMEAGRKVADAKGLIDVLLYDPQKLIEAAEAVRIAQTHLERLQKELDVQDRHQSVEGDPLELEKELLQALETLAGLMSRKEEPDDVVVD